MQRKNNIVLRLHRQRRPEQVLLPLVREENGEALRIILEKQDNVTAEFTQRTEKRVRSGADAGDLRKAEKRILFPASNAGKTV